MEQILAPPSLGGLQAISGKAVVQGLSYSYSTQDSFSSQLLLQSALLKLAETVLGIHHDVMVPLPNRASSHFLSQV